MTTRTALLSELASAQELLYITVHSRKKKVLVRWIVGVIFYVALWHLSWVRILFWIGLVLELILLAFTLRIYFLLKRRIQLIELQLEADTGFKPHEMQASEV